MANALKNLFTDIAAAIRETLTDEPAMSPLSYPDKIREVAKSGTGGGSSDLVKYVTFMSEDGTTELFKMPVLQGDNCKDPIVNGNISEPTKESSNTQHFTYSGWSLTSGGDVDADALKNVDKDKTVYASYTASVRYYTVNLYDEDGTTLLNTVQVTYGSDATNSYVPIKEGYTLAGWEPSVDYVINDIDTFAVWEIDDGLIHDDWDVIAANCDAGNVSKYKLGSKKSVLIGDEEHMFTLVDYVSNHNDTNEYTRGNLIFMADTVLNTPTKATTSYTNSKNYIYPCDPINSYLQDTIEPLLPEKLITVMKFKNDNRDFNIFGNSLYSKLCLPIVRNLFDRNMDDLGNAYTWYDEEYAVSQWKKFEYMPNIKCTTLDGVEAEYWLESYYDADSPMACFIETDGKVAYTPNAHLDSYKKYIRLLFVV